MERLEFDLDVIIADRDHLVARDRADFARAGRGMGDPDGFGAQPTPAHGGDDVVPIRHDHHRKLPHIRPWRLGRPRTPSKQPNHGDHEPRAHPFRA